MLENKITLLKHLGVNLGQICYYLSIQPVIYYNYI